MIKFNNKILKYKWWFKKKKRWTWLFYTNVDLLFKYILPQ